MPVPNSFTGGTPAVAEEVNENFTDLDERVTTLEDAPPPPAPEVSQADLDAEAAARAAADTELDGRVTTLESVDTTSVVVSDTEPVGAAEGTVWFELDAPGGELVAIHVMEA